MINNEIANILMLVGITPDKKGFTYIELVASLMKNNPNISLKEAYNKIAISQNTNSCTIDSSIRNAIHCAHSSGKLLRLNTKMGMEIIDSDCPTNKVFIYYLIRCAYQNTLESIKVLGA